MPTINGGGMAVAVMSASLGDKNYRQWRFILLLPRTE